MTKYEWKVSSQVKIGSWATRHEYIIAPTAADALAICEANFLEYEAGESHDWSARRPPRIEWIHKAGEF